MGKAPLARAFLVVRLRCCVRLSLSVLLPQRAGGVALPRDEADQDGGNANCQGADVSGADAEPEQQRYGDTPFDADTADHPRTKSQGPA